VLGSPCSSSPARASCRRIPGGPHIGLADSERPWPGAKGARLARRALPGVRAGRPARLLTRAITSNPARAFNPYTARMAAYDRTTALVVVDVQNDFADPGGSLYVPGGAEIIPRINEEIARASDAGALVVYSQDWHPPHTPHFQQDGGIWPVHCVAGSWGAAFHPALDVRAGREIIRKGAGGEDGYSVFSVRDVREGTVCPTELEGLLRGAGATRIVLAGLATDYCVKETALDARRLGFEVDILRAAVRAVDLQPGDGDRALAAVAAAGARIR
jgi:nicotinamidase/pyrazinamidase